MIELQSQVENKIISLKELKNKLEPLGYSIGGGWEYDHGYFDYKIDEDGGGYTFLRVPFQAVDGDLEQRRVQVRLGRPFLLNHKYEEGFDEEPNPFNGLVGMNTAGLFNQFTKPVDKDAQVDAKFFPVAQNLIQELEMALSSN
ncbi:YugN-like family protein [Halalkalibacterium halodurans]|uniref:BH3341 protein n=2 Tax=Halalkalibacterium halodurans TaxID=86665 RepID=Q9K7M0_HALH5|nr:YugN-like family protein [Halalkalibacterium halodurans]MDY7223873.1 YugN-like family protein [Halalkalibacterium halodurans]MDY7243094.1 YugN-like family protein [Halalkalibacterium halodurans]MED4161485.1 YugN-like family protein [Halalkalibacterium halodurans]TPE68655.1 hypothetical protein AMD02_012660 [Halalkalibacterium halodurans]BAB07060.1 BH3341 [Halalkalibacterium halodurans C-125]